jgi:hypothetical protein
MEEYLKAVLDYTWLGYEITLFTLHGKDGIRMRKTYSYIAQQPLICEQIIHYSNLSDTLQRSNIFEFLYENIQEQEKSGTYYES